MSNPGRVAGVLGGLGPVATIDFMRRVLDLSDAGSEQEHVRLLVDQNPAVPNRQHALLSDGDSPGPALAAMAQGLERAGADFLVMACNTAHAWQADINAATSLPFLSIVDASVAAIPAGITVVGILETPACRASGLYARAVSAGGFKHVAMTDDECAVLMDIAYAVKRDDSGARETAAARQLATALVERGARAIIVACTEVPLVLDDRDVDVPVVVSTDALARATIAVARGKLPLPSRQEQS